MWQRNRDCLLKLTVCVCVKAEIISFPFKNNLETHLNILNKHIIEYVVLKGQGDVKQTTKSTK